MRQKRSRIDRGTLDKSGEPQCVSLDDESGMEAVETVIRELERAASGQRRGMPT